jgi:hypothetical protein
MRLELFELRRSQFIIRVAKSILTVEDRHDGHCYLLVILSENWDHNVGVVSEGIRIDQNSEKQDLMSLLGPRVA